MAKVTIKTELPFRVEAINIAHFEEMQEALRLVIPKVKVFEVDCAPSKIIYGDGESVYHGIAYLGRKSDEDVKSLVKDIKKEAKASRVTSYAFDTFG